jgi:hypothetical protein
MKPIICRRGALILLLGAPLGFLVLAFFVLYAVINGHGFYF